MRNDMDRVPGNQRLTGADHAPALEVTASPEARRAALYSVLAAIPEGKVVSYGELAALAGLGRAARWVGRTLSQLPDDTRLPWHRVLRASGQIAFPPDSPLFAEQTQRLRAEGVRVENGRVKLRRSGPDLDALLWAPD